MCLAVTNLDPRCSASLAQTATKQVLDSDMSGMVDPMSIGGWYPHTASVGLSHVTWRGVLCLHCDLRWQSACPIACAAVTLVLDSPRPAVSSPLIIIRQSEYSAATVNTFHLHLTTRLFCVWPLRSRGRMCVRLFPPLFSPAVQCFEVDKVKAAIDAALTTTCAQWANDGTLASR